MILPPNYKDKAPDGYIPMPSGDYQGYALLRSILKSGSDEDVKAAVDYAKGIKLYPFSASKPLDTVFVDAIDVVFDATIPYDLRFFQSLDRMVQYEPWLERDKAFIDSLRTIGIEKGKKFEPDAKTKELLESGAAEAHAYMDVRYEDVFKPPFYENARWGLPASPELVQAIMVNYTEPDKYPVDVRGIGYSGQLQPSRPV